MWQELHPETKNGAAGKSRSKVQLAQVEQAENASENSGDPAPRYDEAAAEASGQSPATVRRDVHRGEVLGEDTLAKVARTSLDKGAELDALAKMEMEMEKRDDLIARAAGAASP